MLGPGVESAVGSALVVGNPVFCFFDCDDTLFKTVSLLVRCSIHSKMKRLLTELKRLLQKTGGDLVLNTARSRQDTTPLFLWQPNITNEGVFGSGRLIYQGGRLIQHYPIVTYADEFKSRMEAFAKRNQGTSEYSEEKGACFVLSIEHYKEIEIEKYKNAVALFNILTHNAPGGVSLVFNKDYHTVHLVKHDKSKITGLEDYVAASRKENPVSIMIGDSSEDKTVIDHLYRKGTGAGQIVKSVNETLVVIEGIIGLFRRGGKRSAGASSSSSRR